MPASDLLRLTMARRRKPVLVFTSADARTTSERLDAEISKRTDQAMLALEPVFQQLIRLQLRHPELVPSVSSFIEWLPEHREKG